jgi:hypothetical protein
MKNNAQGAIEYLLIIAAAILVVAIVILAVTGALSGGQEQTSQGVESQGSAFDQLKESASGSVKLNSRVYLKGSPIIEGLIGLWHLDETSGDAIDSSINSNVGSIFEAVPGQPGYFGNQVYFFDGINDYIKVNYTPSLTPKNITVSLWFNSNDITKNKQMFVSKTAESGYNLSLNENSICTWDKLCMLIRIGDAGANNYKEVIADRSLIQNDMWYNLIGTYDGDEGLLYLNGQEVGTNSSLSGDIYYQNNNALCIGSEAGTGNSCNEGLFRMSGLIGEVAIWDRALSADEVEELWNNAQ